MKPRDVFGIIVRSIGMIVLTGSLLYFYSAIAAMDLRPGQAPVSPGRYLIHAVGLLLVGAYLVRGAPHLIRFAYGDDTPKVD